MRILVLNINQKTIERGAEIFWNNLEKELVAHGCEVKVISDKKPCVQNKSPNIFNKILRRLYLDTYSFQVLFFTISNLKQIVQNQADILIPTNGGWQVALISLLKQIKLIGKTKIVLIGHAGIGHDDEFNLRFGNADLFVVLTDKQEKWARKINSKIKIEKIWNGVDTSLFTEEGERVAFDLPRPIFLTVSSLEKYKNIDLTIEAVSQMEKGSLVILGEGPDEKHLQLLCDMKLKGRSYVKTVKHQDLPKYYRGADVFTLVSGHQEAFGLVYLEAMACGLPCVATRDPNRLEIVGNAGEFVDPQDFEEYKTALMKTAVLNWTDKPRKQAEKFGWERIGDRYFKTFQQILT